MQQPGRGGYAPHTYPGPHQQHINIRSLFAGAVFHHPYQVQGKPATATPHIPVYPDVKLKKLPFYEVSAELIKPSTLVPQGSQRQQDNTFVFHLTPQQATMIGMSRDMRPGSKVEYAVQVQLRFGMLDTTSEQDDCFPPGIMVKVNNKLCQLPNPIPTNKPGAEPKRPPRPVNITPFIKISPTVGNIIHIQWMAEYGRGYVVGVYLVQKKTPEDLLNRLIEKGVRESEFTRSMIKEKLTEDADCEIATTSLRVSLNCPLGKMRMSTPCRASTCEHLQCFDALLYLQMNERKPTWLCPICDKPALYDKLVVDGYFQEVLNSELLTEDINEIQLESDGSWSFLICHREIASDPEETTQSESEQGFEIDLDPDLVAQITAAAEAAEAAARGERPPITNHDNDGEVIPVRKKKKEEVIDLTLSDSDDDDDDDDSPIPVKKTIMEPVHYIRLTTETKRTPTTCRASGAALNAGNRSPSLIILDGDSPPGTPDPLRAVATTSTMLAPTATVTVTAAAAAAAAKAKAAVTALAAARAMATAMATATATLNQAQNSVGAINTQITQPFGQPLNSAMASGGRQSAQSNRNTVVAELDPSLGLTPPPYNALLQYINSPPCHFLDIDANAALRRF